MMGRVYSWITSMPIPLPKIRPIFMQKARTSLAQAKERVDNSRSIIFTEKKWADLLEQAKTRKQTHLSRCANGMVPSLPFDGAEYFHPQPRSRFYNSNFINVTMDMEKGEGPALDKIQDNCLSYLPVYRSYGQSGPYG